MKIWILCISLVLVASCSSQPDSMISPVNEVTPTNEALASRVLFVGNNAINGAYYDIIISCVDGAPRSIQDIPEDQTVEIILMEDCKKHRIPKETMDALTKKKFYYVYWDFYFQGQNDYNLKYQLDSEEATKIGGAPWKIQALDGLQKDSAKIIRNTKNTVREAFEPTGNRNFYTEEEAAKCDIFWKGSESIEDMAIWRTYADKVLRCYGELPPLP